MKLVHPVERIRGSVAKYLDGKCIALGLTGSVAIYKALDTARWLIRRGARVIPILTTRAQEFLGEKLVKWATGEEPVTRLSGEVEHIGLAEECDLILIAPATLSTISKIAWGISDTSVSLSAISFLGMRKPVIVVPAMHYNMLRTLQYEQSIAQLKRLGVILIPPYIEEKEDVAKYPDPYLVGRVVAGIALRGRDLEERKFLVTAGASREWFDPVRFISNPSSGLMGLEVALEAYARGAEVHFIHGSVKFDPPHIFKNYYCDTTEDFRKAIESLTEETAFDAIISAAALADFRPESFIQEKITSGKTVETRLTPTPKALKGIKKRPKALVIFVAETAKSLDELEKKAKEKLNKYDADIAVANIVWKDSKGFSSRYLEGIIVNRTGNTVKRIEGKLKEEVARIIVDEVLKLVKGD